MTGVAPSGDSAIFRPMEQNGHRDAGVLREHLLRAEKMREQIAKAWLADVILDSPLAEVERMPMGWATGELPKLISDILAAAAATDTEPFLSPEARDRAARLAELRRESPPAQLTHEVSALHQTVLAVVRQHLAEEPHLVGEAAARLAAIFGLVTATAVEALFSAADGNRDPVTGLSWSRQMRRRLDQLIALSARYRQDFTLILIDVDGPGMREADREHGPEATLATVSGLLRESIRISDEAFRLENDEICVLAPNLTADDGSRMADRLSKMLASLDVAEDLRITISAGVVACPEHGNEPDQLLRRADTAMWRARATGVAVSLGAVQDP